MFRSHGMFSAFCPHWMRCFYQFRIIGMIYAFIWKYLWKQSHSFPYPYYQPSCRRCMRQKTRPQSWNNPKRFKRRKRPQKRRSTRFGMIRLFFPTFEAALLKASRRIIAPIVSRKPTIRGTKTPRAPKPLSVTDLWRHITEKPRPSRCIL